MYLNAGRIDPPCDAVQLCCKVSVYDDGSKRLCVRVSLSAARHIPSYMSEAHRHVLACGTRSGCLGAFYRSISPVPLASAGITRDLANGSHWLIWTNESGYFLSCAYSPCIIKGREWRELVRVENPVVLYNGS